MSKSDELSSKSISRRELARAVVASVGMSAVAPLIDLHRFSPAEVSPAVRALQHRRRLRGCTRGLLHEQLRGWQSRRRRWERP